MIRRSIDEVPKEIEDKLMQDIRDFMGLFKRQPVELEVTDWATDRYHQKLYGLHNGWATGLIERTMAEPGSED